MLARVLISIFLVFCLSNCGGSSSSGTSTTSEKPFTKIPGVDRLRLEFFDRIKSYNGGTVSLEIFLINIGYSETAVAKTSHFFAPLSVNNLYDRSYNTLTVPSIDGSVYSKSHTIKNYEDGSYLWQSTVDAITPRGIDPSEISHPTKNYTIFTLGGVRIKNGAVVDYCTRLSNDNKGKADPYGSYLWHIKNTGQDTLAQNHGVSGADLNITSHSLSVSKAGEGIIVAVVDSGGEICHPDLDDNTIAEQSVNFVNNSSDTFHVDIFDRHGTAMAGIIASEKNNGVGGYGIAYHAKLKFFNYLHNQSDANFASALGSSTNSSDVDIFNQSFGSGSYRFADSNIADNELSDYVHGVNQLRDGLGAIYVKSAGNSFEDCFYNTSLSSIQSKIGCLNANIDPLNNIPYQIVMGAFNAKNVKSSYSSVGSLLWVSAPGGEYGTTNPALLSTDPQSCQAGRNIKYGTYGGEQVDNKCDYTKSANGTSSAAAAASGAIALLLATPASDGSTNSLTWRDVKHILAKTARKLDANQDHAVMYSIGAEDMIAQHAWQENSAGYWYHNWYGFGAIDVAAASSMVQNYTPDSLGSFSTTTWLAKNSNLTIPDNDADGVSDKQTITGIDGNIEATLLRIDISHPITYDLHIEITSPNGSKSIVHTLFNRNFAANENFSKWQLLTNAFYGETINGEWQIKVIDGMGQDVGTLNSWALKFYYGKHP